MENVNKHDESLFRLLNLNMVPWIQIQEGYTYMWQSK